MLPLPRHTFFFPPPLPSWSSSRLVPPASWGWARTRGRASAIKGYQIRSQSRRRRRRGGGARGQQGSRRVSTIMALTHAYSGQQRGRRKLPQLPADNEMLLNGLITVGPCPSDRQSLSGAWKVEARRRQREQRLRASAPSFWLIFSVSSASESDVLLSLLACLLVVLVVRPIWRRRESRLTGGWDESCMAHVRGAGRATQAEGSLILPGQRSGRGTDEKQQQQQQQAEEGGTKKASFSGSSGTTAPHRRNKPDLAI